MPEARGGRRPRREPRPPQTCPAGCGQASPAAWGGWAGRRREGDRRLEDQAVTPDGLSLLVDQTKFYTGLGERHSPAPGQGSWGAREPRASDPVTPAELSSISAREGRIE